MEKTSKHTLLDSVLFTVLAIPVIFFILRDLIVALLGLLVYNAFIQIKETRFFGGQLGILSLHLTPIYTIGTPNRTQSHNFFEPTMFYCTAGSFFALFI